MVVKSISSDARASATGVAFYQRAQTTGAYLRPEKLLFLGNYQTGKTIEKNVIYSGSGNADDAGTMFGFGSPMHRMALKAFPSDGSGANVETYFLPVPEIESGTNHKLNLSVNGTPTNNATLYLRYKEQLFEAAADIASKVATSAHSNPALDPKGIKLNAYNYEKIPFTLQKGKSAKEILTAIKEALDEYVEVPFTSVVDDKASATAAKIKSSLAIDCTELTEDDYYAAYSVDGGERKEISIGTISAETAEDVITALSGRLSGLTISADSSGEAVSTYTLTSQTSGASSKIEILSPSTGTDLFAALNISGTANGSSTIVLTLESKIKGETGKFEIDVVNSEYKPVTEADYGVSFSTAVTSEAAGLVKIDDYLELITEELGITRVCSQFNDDNSLDAMREYFQGWRTDTKIAQYVICYTAKEFPEDKLKEGTVDIDELVKFGNSRRDDQINVQIFGDYGKLRPLKWALRDKLLKAGIPNLEPMADSGYQIGDLCTFYHPQGSKKTLYMYDRDACCLGNIAYNMLYPFKYDENWRSVIVIDDEDEESKTTNPKIKKISAFVDKINSIIRVLGEAGILAGIEKSIGYTIGQIDNTNSDRININTFPTLSSVNRIVDICNMVGFNYGG